MANFRDDAICIRHWDWSETSQTVSLLTRKHGVLRGIAKGSKREKGNFSGGIELLTAGQVLAVVKPNTSLATLTAWDLGETFPVLRTSLAAHNVGMYMADLTGSLVHEGDPHEVLFEALLEQLGQLDRSPPMLAALRFQWVALSEAGYQPAIERDAGTAEPIHDADVFRFSPRLGGFVNDRLGGGDQSGRDDHSVWRVRAETRQLLRAIASDTDVPSTISDASGVDLERAARLLAAYVREILGRELGSYRCVFGQGSA